MSGGGAGFFSAKTQENGQGAIWTARPAGSPARPAAIQLCQALPTRTGVAPLTSCKANGNKKRSNRQMPPGRRLRIVMPAPVLDRW